MGEDSLRLFLEVRRNGLTPAHIVYTFLVDNETTVFKLLEQLNDIIPLESVDWGLDDYVTELKTAHGRTYECLHYHCVRKLIEKDDEVLIRPLSSDELKKRKLSGRHQISSDGKHLLDGVPFGRPLIKRPVQRPPIYISPRRGGQIGVMDEQLMSDPNPPDELLESHLKEPHNHLRLVHYRGDICDEDEADGNDYIESGRSENSGESENGEHQGFSEASDDGDSTCDSEAELGLDELTQLREEAEGVDPAYQPRAQFYETPSEVDVRRSEVDSNQQETSQSKDVDGHKTTKIAPGQGKLRTKKRNSRRRAKFALERVQKKQTESTRSEPKSTQSQDTPLSPSATALADADSKSQTGQRRLLLNLDASRRMLMSALGFSSKGAANATSKTEARLLQVQAPSPQEQITRDREYETRSDPGKSNQPYENDPKHWKNRVIYRAVECWGTDIPLSEPPFPFVQRWDSSPKRNAPSNKFGLKRKQSVAFDTQEGSPRKKRTTQDFLKCGTSSSGGDLSSTSDSGSDSKAEAASNSFDSDSGDSTSGDGNSESCSSEDDNPSTTGERIKAEVKKGADLPALPMDLSTLTLLEQSAAAPGMIITWKKWVLSNKTGWQPQVVDVTASILSVEAGGARFRVCLAQRDRGLDRIEKAYDEETGERVYGKFEAPDIDSEERGRSDSDILEVVFADLIEPRIVRQCTTGQE